MRAFGTTTKRTPHLNQTTRHSGKETIACSFQVLFPNSIVHQSLDSNWFEHTCRLESCPLKRIDQEKWVVTTTTTRTYRINTNKSRRLYHSPYLNAQIVIEQKLWRICCGVQNMLDPSNPTICVIGQTFCKLFKKCVYMNS